MRVISGCVRCHSGVRSAMVFFVSLLSLISNAAWSDSASPSGDTSHKEQSSAAAFRTPRDVFLVEPSRRMQAKGFKWDHEIRIALPPSYSKTSKTYPVLWVTDGSWLFEHAVLALSIMGKQYVPEMIVVGIGTPPEASKESGARRMYDFTASGQWGFEWDFEGFGSELVNAQKEDADKRLKAYRSSLSTESGGAPEFLEFLLDTVRPALARDYRMANEHTLFGESLGGFFCTYALFARPGAFNKYLCASPGSTWGNHALLRIEEHYSKTHKDLPAEVLFSAGEEEILQGGLISAGGTVSSMVRMAEILKLRAYPSLQLHVRIFSGEDHGSVIAANFGRGLRTLWEDETGNE